MKRPVTVCTPSSVKTASFTRWLAVTFCKNGQKQRISLHMDFSPKKNLLNVKRAFHHVSVNMQEQGIAYLR